MGEDRSHYGRVSVPIKSDEIPEKATALGQNQQDAGEAEQ